MLKHNEYTSLMKVKLKKALALYREKMQAKATYLKYLKMGIMNFQRKVSLSSQLV